jgi:hypothetical protein
MGGEGLVLPPLGLLSSSWFLSIVLPWLRTTQGCLHVPLGPIFASPRDLYLVCLGSPPVPLLPPTLSLIFCNLVLFQPHMFHSTHQLAYTHSRASLSPLTSLLATQSCHPFVPLTPPSANYFRSRLLFLYAPLRSLASTCDSVLRLVRCSSPVLADSYGGIKNVGEPKRPIASLTLGCSPDGSWARRLAFG